MMTTPSPASTKMSVKTVTEGPEEMLMGALEGVAEGVLMTGPENSWRGLRPRPRLSSQDGVVREGVRACARG